VTFQVTNQLKILPTAAFSVVALNRALRPQQWLSLPLLAVGVAVVNLSASAHAARSHLGDASEAAVLAAAGGEGAAAKLRWWAGLCAALAAALCSGYSSVAVERMLKMEERAAADCADAKAEEGAGLSPVKPQAADKTLDDPPLPLSAPGGDAAPAEPHRGRPLLTLNLQLAAWGALISVLQLAFFNADALRGSGLTENFNAFTWAVILLQALGGLVVGVVLKYTDNIVKGFATAASILLSFVLESVAAGRTPTLTFVFGLALVVASFALFSGPEDLLLRAMGPQGYALAAAAAADTAAAAVACARGACSPAAPPARAGAVMAAAAGVAGCLAVTALYLHDAPQPPAPPMLLPSALLRNATTLLLATAPPIALPAAPGAGELSSEAGGAGLGGGSAASADDYSMHAEPLPALALAALEEANEAQRLPAVRMSGDAPSGEAAASAFATDVTLLADVAHAEEDLMEDDERDEAFENEEQWSDWAAASAAEAANSSTVWAAAMPPPLSPALGGESKLEKRRGTGPAWSRNGTAELLAERDEAARAAQARRAAEREALPRAASFLASATDQGGAVLATPGATAAGKTV
jgi:UDP-sugar transporter A1/2/3